MNSRLLHPFPRRWQVPLAAMWLVGVFVSDLHADSIFDDDWVSPKVAAPATRPEEVIQPKLPLPEPAVPTAPGDKLPATRAAPPLIAETPTASPLRRPVPAPAEQARSRKLFKEVFAKDLSDHSAKARRVWPRNFLNRRQVSAMRRPTNLCCWLARRKPGKRAPILY